jgi:hypothetical protein
MRREYEGELVRREEEMQREIRRLRQQAVAGRR